MWECLNFLITSKRKVNRNKYKADNMVVVSKIRSQDLEISQDLKYLIKKSFLKVRHINKRRPYPRKKHLRRINHIAILEIHTNFFILGKIILSKKHVHILFIKPKNLQDINFNVEQQLL